MIRAFCLFIAALTFASSVMAIGTPTQATGGVQASSTAAQPVWRVAKDDPPWPGCKRECTPMKKCTPGPCKRVGDTLVCEKERCETIQSCGWVCPSK